MIRYFVILWLTAMCGAQATSTANPTSRDKSHYENDLVGISYSMPTGYSIVAKNAENEQQRAIGQRILIIADKLTGRPFKNRIVLALDEARNYAKTSTEPALSFKDYAAKLLSMNGKRPGVTIKNNLIPLEVTGVTLYRGDYLEVFPEATFHKVLVSVEINGYWLSWTFVSTEDKELEELVESVLAAKFSPRTRPRKAT
jgi:hypothetical protein